MALRDSTVSFLADQEHALAAEVAHLREALHVAVARLRERDLELTRLRGQHHQLRDQYRRLREQVLRDEQRAA